MGSSTSTTFVYNSFGDLIGTTDADGNTRTIAYDAMGRQNGTSFVWNDPLGVLARRTLTTSVKVGPDGKVDTSTNAQSQTSITLYDALGRAYQQIDANGRVSETIYDKRGLAIETRSQASGENGNTVQMISRTVYDASGRAIYSTGSFTADVFANSPSQITGTHTIYDAQGRVEKTEQLLGIDIDIVGQLSQLSSVLTSSGSVISFSLSLYDDAGRVIETQNDQGLRSQTLYGQFGEVVESRTEVPPASGLPSGASSWLVSRTIYDSFGRAAISTDRFLVPIDTPLGQDPSTGPVPTEITETIYDSRGRSIATERYTDAVVTLPLAGSAQPGRAAFVITSPGTLESVSETLYDAAGRVWRTISGRVPVSVLSATSAVQSSALANYPTHGAGVTDPYAAQNLSSGVISDTLFDSRGRQFASLGHPLPAADVGLTGSNYDGKLVRPRTETIYDSLGQARVQRSGLAQVESSTGVLQGIYDNDSVDTKTYTDAFGNVYRTEFITGGTIEVVDAQNNPLTLPLAGGSGGGTTTGEGLRTRRTGNYIVDSYTLTHFDNENRPIAEMQSVPGFVTAVYDATLKSFKVQSVGPTTGSPYAFTAASYTVGAPIPTKVYHYDADDRLAGVSLPILSVDLQSPASSLRPKYEYAYDHQGNQTLIRDPLGRETRFTFTERGQQATRTLPVGVQGLAASATPTPSSPFTESFTYDARGRQVLHVSFEGVITENIYDSFGRLSHMNYYANAADLTTGTISERWSYAYDARGRKHVAQHSVQSSPGVFTTTRTEQTIYDDRDRVIAEVTPEGVLSYTYDTQGRMATVAISETLTSPVSSLKSYAYDILGRLVSVTEDSTPTNISDEPQIETDYTFDLAGRADTTTTTEPQSASSRVLRTDYDYDSLGRLDTQTDTDESNNVLASYDYTVRADGKRTSLNETHWFDVDEDGNVDSGEQKSTAYSWTYDAVVRLTDEVIDHWDNAFDQTESFTYDLTGNRLQLDRDHGNDGIDEVITYDYDANDRLLEEVLDDLVNDADDTTTTYAYDHTQQTEIIVTRSVSEATVSKQLFTFNLQGRIATVINEAYTDGTLSSRERTGYEYNSGSYRVSLLTHDGTTLGALETETWNLKSETSFLADSRNFTGYTQTLRETTANADGTSKTVDYTFGQDEIAQRSVERDDQGAITSDETLVFGHDGHGSVRVLYDLAEATAGLINQVATFAAYGQVIAAHAANAAVAGTNESAFNSNLGYSGEQWDASLRMQNLRARAYDPANGRFIGLDPFAGNMQDPQSLHKYAYVHGDPVQGVDPTGWLGDFSISGLLSNVNLNANMRAIQMGPTLNALNTANSFRRTIRAYQNVLKIVNKLEDLYSTINDVLDILAFDPSDLKDIFQQVTGQLAVNSILTGKREAKIALPPGALKKFQSLGRRIESLPIVGNEISETLGEYAMALVLGAIGFEPAHAGWTTRNPSGNGIDQIAYSANFNVFAVAEAKGGTSKLKPGQMSHGWIKNHLQFVISSNSGEMRNKLKGHHQFQSMIAMVVKFQYSGSHQIKIEAQPYNQNIPAMANWQIDNPGF